MSNSSTLSSEKKIIIRSFKNKRLQKGICEIIRRKKEIGNEIINERKNLNHVLVLGNLVKYVITADSVTLKKFVISFMKHLINVF